MARGDGIHRTSARNARMKDTDIDNAQAHNEREKASYVNQDIVPERTPYNVHFKKPTAGYMEMFEQMRSDGVISTRGLKADAEKFGPGMTVELPAYRRKQIDIFYPDEIQRLAQMIMDEPTTTGIGILLTLNTGLRLGELCALQYKDIDLRNGVVHVRKTVQRIRSGDRTSLMVLPPKSDSARRTIPLPGDMAALLQKLVQSHPNGENYLLTGKNVPMEPRTMQYQYRALLKAAGIPYRNFHTLRHTYASRCVERGIDVKSLSEMLGHADVRTTLQVYVHSSLEHKMRVIQSICFLAPALAAEFAPSPSPSVFPETLQYQQLLAALSQMG